VTDPASSAKPDARNGAKPKRRKGRKRGGNKSKITGVFLRRVEKLAALGLNQRQIASILNVGACTISIWKSSDGELETKFQKALEKGNSRGIERRLARIESAGKAGSWQADAWTLERRNPEQFGRRDAVRLSDADGKPLPGTTVIAPTVVFVQPEKRALDDVFDLPPKLVTNGEGKP